jgi:hypothetical protein
MKTIAILIPPGKQNEAQEQGRKKYWQLFFVQGEMKKLFQTENVYRTDEKKEGNFFTPENNRKCDE